MDLTQFENLSGAAMAGMAVGMLVFGFISLLISALIVQAASNWSAKFKPKFWPAVLWVFVASIISAVLGFFFEHWAINLVLGFVIAAIVFKLFLKGEQGQRFEWGQAFIVSLIYNIAWIVIGLAIGLVAILLLGIVA